MVRQLGEARALLGLRDFFWAEQRCQELAESDDAWVQANRHRLLGEIYYCWAETLLPSEAESYWTGAESEFIRCTHNRFSHAMIHDLIQQAMRSKPRHLKRILFFSRLIPGFAHVYVGDIGKAVGNFGLIGGLAVSTAIFWPIAIQFGAFALLDWVSNGARNARDSVLASISSKHELTLQRIITLSRAVP